MKTMCANCGHEKAAHIYEEGACRPGYPCFCASYMKPASADGIPDGLENAGEAWAQNRLSHFSVWDTLPISSIESIAEEAFDAGLKKCEGERSKQAEECAKMLLAQAETIANLMEQNEKLVIVLKFYADHYSSGAAQAAIDAYRSKV